MTSNVRPAWGRVPYDMPSRTPWLRVPFTREEYADRWRRVGEAMGQGGLRAVVVLGGPGDSGLLRYLTNYDSNAGYTAAVVTPDGRCAMATNSLLRGEPMHSGVWMSYVEDVRPTMSRRYNPSAPTLEEKVAEVLSDYGAEGGSIGFAGMANRDMWMVLNRVSNGRVVDFSAELNETMTIKSPAEVELLRRANTVSEQAYAAIRAEMKAGVTEMHLAGVAFEVAMGSGAENLSFPMALVGGPRGGLKHVLPTDYALREGDMVFMDFGLVFDGYVTDNAKTAVVGHGSEDVLHYVRTADDMTKASVAAIKPGVAQNVIDDVAFEVACEAGLSDDYYFRAHGVGTTLFQFPRFFPGDGTTLREGQVFSLEPMITRLGFGGACVERTILVTKDGCELLGGTTDGVWVDHAQT